MFDNREIFTRELTARERRRYRKHRTLPIDSLQTSIALSVIVEQFQPRKFYRYGCELVDAFIELDDNNSSNDKVIEQGNSIFHLRGFISPSNFCLSLCCVFFHSNLQCASLSHIIKFHFLSFACIELIDFPLNHVVVVTIHHHRHHHHHHRRTSNRISTYQISYDIKITAAKSTRKSVENRRRL